MKKVDQTKYGPVDGNCWAACIASLLELPIDEVQITGAEATWLENTQEWLATRGLFYVGLKLDAFGKWQYPLYKFPQVPVLLAGKSPRGGCNHAVLGHVDHVTQQFVIDHDPHPDRAGIDGNPFEIGFLVPLDVSKII